MNSDPVRYELDKDSGLLHVDRFIGTSMYYPCNYGFIPNSLGNDKDPLDIMLVSSYPVLSGAVVKTRVIGMLVMEDESGMDEKLLAVPISKLDPSYDAFHDITDVNEVFKKKIEHFFSRHKDLEKNKWVKVQDWADKNAALALIKKSLI